MFSSVYRLQLSEKLPLEQATLLLPQLADLGIDGIYCSPIYKAGSDHGYDVLDPNRLNPKLGTEKDLEAFVKACHSHKMAIVLDVVPNHMGIKGNPWWNNVLKQGQASPFAKFFDIDWERTGKVLLPILGEPLEEAHFEREGDSLRYNDWLLPLCCDQLEEQHYQLAYWKRAAHEINYRRFFNIHDLAAICIEDDEVFLSYHKWLFSLVKKGWVDAVRIDHPDGLYDPIAYFQNLRKHIDVPILVEKILDREERLPASWEVEGTVGYEYLNLLNGLFIDTQTTEAFTTIYDTFLGHDVDYYAELIAAKKTFALTEMASEMEMLARSLHKLCGEDHADEIVEMIARFPVYRSYITPEGTLSEHDRDVIEQAQPSPFLKQVFLGGEKKYLPWILRFQQLTGPIMAKGLEDTLFYTFNRFISLNEVGGDLLHFGTTAEQFHNFNLEKRARWPLGLLATSTHDTKRSEDVRMRLNVLSEMPQKWEEKVTTWRKMNAVFKGPTPNLEYFIYQMLVGIGPDVDLQRFWTILRKSMREAKCETSWMHPNFTYEKSVHRFVAEILNTRFREDLAAFFKEIDAHAKLGSLSMCALKIGSPGVVDIYQGNESFHYRLVDPDNRAPVNYPRPHDLKFHIQHKALNFRKAHKELFLHGDYIPLETQSHHAIAFARMYKKEIVIVLASRFFSTLKVWDKVSLILPKEWKGLEFFDIFTEKKSPSMELETLLQTYPVSYLYAKHNH